MKRWYVIVAIAVAATGVALLALPRTPVWTTSSEEARQELERGLDAERKLYYDEARQHFETALQLDPNFLIAKLFVGQSIDPKTDQARRKQLLDGVFKADTSGLSARERFFIAMAAANAAHDQAKLETTLAAYLDKHPDDPYAINFRAARAFSANDLEAAASDYRRLAEIAPNFVLAYNQLGYIAMSQGRFADAESLLKKYRYVAPEQANPHDSLGELYSITGRYREARAEFEEALRVKPQFCTAYLHLAELALLNADYDEADAAAARAAAQPSCPAGDRDRLQRSVAVWRAVGAQDWATVIRVAEAGKGEGEGEADGGGDQRVLLHLALCRSGRVTEAEAIETALRAQFDKLKTASAKARSMLPATIAFLEGQRLLIGGDAAAAAERFRKVEGLVPWQGLDNGLFKLYDLLMLIRAQRASGDGDGAAKTLASIAAVNPAFAEAVTQGRGIFGAAAASS